MNGAALSAGQFVEHQHGCGEPRGFGSGWSSWISVFFVVYPFPCSWRQFVHFFACSKECVRRLVLHLPDVPASWEGWATRTLPRHLVGFTLLCSRRALARKSRPQTEFSGSACFPEDSSQVPQNEKAKCTREKCTAPPAGSIWFGANQDLSKNDCQIRGFYTYPRKVPRNFLHNREK